MRYIAIALAFASIINLAAIVSARAEIRITNDTGGSVAAYVDRVEAARASGEHVTVDGLCASACTIWLILPSSQICATPRAVFAFHSATNELGLPDPAWNDKLLGMWPPKVRYYVLRHGGLWLNVIRVRGIALIRRCK